MITMLKLLFFSSRKGKKPTMMLTTIVDVVNFRINSNNKWLTLLSFGVVDKHVNYQERKVYYKSNNIM